MQENTRRILLVDHDEYTGLLVEPIFRYAGYEAVTVSSIADGFTQAQGNHFEFILLDWHLKDGTGIDLCRQIRNFDEITPIFFYSSVAYPQEIKKALAAGAQGCFIKPVQIKHLLRTIEGHFNNVHFQDSAA